jgi:TonB family protein
LATESGAGATIAIDREAVGRRLSENLETALPAAPQSGEVRSAAADPARLAIHRGDMLLAAGKTAAAAGWYNADSDEARAARAILNRYNRGSTEALRSLERTSRELPDFGLVHFHFGSIESDVPRDIENQVIALEKSVELLPDFGPAHVELARTYALSGNGSKAMAMISRALVLSPQLADRIYEIRALAHSALKEFNEAVRAADIADRLPHGDRAAAEKFSLRVRAVKRRIDEARQQVEDQRVQEIRRDVAAIVSEREPTPAPAPPPPPVPPGRIAYQVESRTPLEVVNAVLPDYPEALRKAGTAGSITFRVDVGADGKVKAASVAESQVSALNAATLEAVRQWTFKAPRAASIRVIVQYFLQ